MSLPRYPEYKDSGVEWLGEVPVHWDVVKLKRLCQMQSGDFISPSDIEDEGLYPVYGGNGQRGFTSNYTHSGLYPIVGRQGALCGNINYASGKFWASEHAIVASPEGENSPLWLGELLRAMNLNQYSITAAQPGLAVEKIKNIFTPRPSLNEQRAIASFLDYETARIDALVEEQQRLIALLKEKQQAVISHAVTKGLDPDVPMKDSGVEWLGEVPGHWEVVPLGLLACQIQTGPFGSQLHSHEYVEGGVPVINPSNIVDGEILPDPSSTVTQEVVERLAHQRLSEGEIVVGRRGEMGRCAVVSSEESGWVCGTGSMKILLSEHADPDFVSMFIRTPLVRGLLQIESVGSTMDNLNPEILSRVRVPVPPIEEQRDLVEKVRLTEGKTQRLISEALQGSELLQERRSVLISAAVTGKIDVRGWKPPVGTSATTEANQTEAV